MGFVKYNRTSAGGYLPETTVYGSCFIFVAEDDC